MGPLEARLDWIPHNWGALRGSFGFTMLSPIGTGGLSHHEAEVFQGALTAFSLSQFDYVFGKNLLSRDSCSEASVFEY